MRLIGILPEFPMSIAQIFPRLSHFPPEVLPYWGVVTIGAPIIITATRERQHNYQQSCISHASSVREKASLCSRKLAPALAGADAVRFQEFQQLAIKDIRHLNVRDMACSRDQRQLATGNGIGDVFRLGREIRAIQFAA